LKQLAEYITGMDTRIGYPNEHLAGDSDAETTSPLYATAVGLVLSSLEKKDARFQEQVILKEPEEPKDKSDSETGADADEKTSTDITKPTKKSIFDKWAEKFKDFLDNAE